MVIEHVRTFFIVSWLPGGGAELVEEMARKADAMAYARRQAASSWSGTAVVEMMLEESVGHELRARRCRAWEVTPDSCEQVSGRPERKGAGR